MGMSKTTEVSLTLELIVPERKKSSGVDKLGNNASVNFDFIWTSKPKNCFGLINFVAFTNRKSSIIPRIKDANLLYLKSPSINRLIASES